MIAMILFRLILLHTPDGQDIWINPDLIVSLRPKGGHGNFPENAHCYITLEDGKFAAVAEHCETVKKMGEEK